MRKSEIFIWGNFHATTGDRAVMRCEVGKFVFPVFASFLILTAFTCVSSARTIYVPDDYEKIQWAVDNASAGDTIIVRDGTYVENVNVNKRLTIMLENGSDKTIVQAKNPDDHVLEVTADYANISGFTVKGAVGSWKGGIYLENVEHCNIINNNASNNYHGIYLRYSFNNILTNNTAISNNNSGIYLLHSSNNTISNNNIVNNTNAVALSNSNYNAVTNNNCSYNRGDSIVTYSPSHNNLIVSNIANSNFIGICIGSKDNVVSNNVAINNTYGIYNVYANNTEITNNICSRNKWGIDLWSSNYVLIANNTVKSNTVAGINLRAYSTYNTLTCNNIIE